MLALPLRKSAWALVTCLALLSSPVVGVADAQPVDPAYQSVIAEAVGEFGAGHWAEARALFKRAHKMSPNARTLRGMGMCAYELRMYVPALRELQGALQERRRPLSGDQRTQVGALIGHAANFVGRYRVSVTPADASVTLDGKPAQFDPGNLLFLELGEHAIVATKGGYESATQKVRVEGAENSELHIELMPKVVAAAPVAAAAQPAQPTPAAPPAEPAPAPAPATEPEPAAEERGPGLAIAGWLSIGVSVGAAIAAGVYWGQAESELDELGKICGPGSPSMRACTQAQIDATEVDKIDTVATIALVASIVTGVAGVTLLVIDSTLGGGDSDTASAGTRVKLGPGALSIEGSF